MRISDGSSDGCSSDLGGKGRLHERLRGTHGEESGWGFGEKDASCWRNSTPAAPGGDATLSPAHGPIGGPHTPPLACPAPIRRNEVVEGESARPLRFSLKNTGAEGRPRPEERRVGQAGVRTCS